MDDVVYVLAHERALKLRELIDERLSRPDQRCMFGRPPPSPRHAASIRLGSDILVLAAIASAVTASIWRDSASPDELLEVVTGDPHVLADLVEADAPLVDEPAN